MFVFARAVTYAALFIGFLLIYLPGRVLSWSGIVRPAAIEAPQVAGMVLGAIGAAVALWCIFTFATIGRGPPQLPLPHQALQSTESQSAAPAGLRGCRGEGNPHRE
jgi:hypothetical protein